jgi:hypothetical protein
MNALKLRGRGFNMIVDAVAGDGPGRYCPSRHRMPLNTGNERSQQRWTTRRATSACPCGPVARSHPNYATAHLHEAHDPEDAYSCKPFGYFNMTLCSCPPEELWSAFEVWPAGYSSSRHSTPFD